MAENGNFDIQLPPYAQSLGMRIDGQDTAGSPVISCDFADRLMGRPGFLHGGAIAGLLEIAAHAAIRAQLQADGQTRRIKPINVTVDYLRGGAEKPTYASGKVTRLGRRIATVEAFAWQDDPAKPIASAQMNLLISG